MCNSVCVTFTWVAFVVVVNIPISQAVWHSESSSRQGAEQGTKAFALEPITQPCSQSTGHRKRWKGVEQGGPVLIITRRRPDLCSAPAGGLLPAGRFSLLCRHLLPALDMVSAGRMANPERGLGSRARAPMLRVRAAPSRWARVTLRPSGALGCRYGRWRWWRRAWRDQSLACLDSRPPADGVTGSGGVWQEGGSPCLGPGPTG